MKDYLGKIWRIARWPLGVLLLLYVGLVAWRIYAIGEEEKTAAAVERIHASRLTASDVMGEHLPIAPNEEVNNATLAGVDNNENGIRDDVELAIFTKYPNDAKVRSGLLQYAKAMQMEFTEVFNSETLVAVIQEESRGSMCILDWDRTKEIDALVLNTPERKKFQQEIFDKYMTSYSLPNSDYCDVDLQSPSN